MNRREFSNRPILGVPGVTVGLGSIEAVLQGELHDDLLQVIDGHSSSSQKGEALLAINEDELTFLDKGFCLCQE